MNIQILYEDNDCLVINKPSGLMVHPDGRGNGPFLTDWIISKYPEVYSVGESFKTPEGEEISRPGIVHRLDRETSGALIVAKTSKGHSALKKQFQGRLISKKYLAFVWGELSEDFGTIKKPIGRSPSDFRRWSAQPGARGELREAETYWTKIKSFRSKIGDDKSERFTLVEAEPKTGRTHQIRVHMLAIHHPVVGDMLYAPKKPYVLGFDRTALHAKSIEFVSPDTGKVVKVEASLPEDFVKAMKDSDISDK